MAPGHLLLIEDTAALRLVYAAALRSAGHEVAAAASAAEGRAAFRQSPPAAVVLDLMLPDGDGIELMRDLLAIRPGTPFIVVTSDGPITRAVEAMRAGAHDFLVKPFDNQNLLSAVENALAASLPNLPLSADPPEGIVGRSDAMLQVYAKMRSVARSMATVFITGESGTGKELCARAIHDLSPRAGGPFVPLDCGAIAHELPESELFAHNKGSLAGTMSDWVGAAAAADGGTLFLDDICELDPSLQAKLLRFLQTSTIQPAGSAEPRKINVRIICATSHDPLESVGRGRLREDLYYRLHVVPIHMPPLRDRGDDVIAIAEKALAELSREEGRRFTRLSEPVRRIFRAHPWPGNVRQLLNILRQTVIMNDGTEVAAAMLPSELVQGSTLPGAPTPGRDALIDSLAGRTLAEIERLVIERTIALHGGSITRAARSLDVAPSTLYRKLDGWSGKQRES